MIDAFGVVFRCSVSEPAGRPSVNSSQKSQRKALLIAITVLDVVARDAVNALGTEFDLTLLAQAALTG